MTPKEQAAMQQALEYLKGTKTVFTEDEELDEAITALREALAEQEKPLYRKVLREMLDAHEQAEQEPVAWAYEYGTDRGDAVNEIRWYPNLTALNKPKPIEGCLIRNVRPLYATPQPVQQAEQEPVAWLAQDDTFWLEKGSDTDIPLYTAPVRTKDLTDDEIEEIHKSFMSRGVYAVVDEARAVIAADRSKNK